LEPCFALLCSMMMESCTESWKPILAVAGKKKKCRWMHGIGKKGRRSIRLGFALRRTRTHWHSHRPEHAGARSAGVDACRHLLHAARRSNESNPTPGSPTIPSPARSDPAVPLVSISILLRPFFWVLCVCVCVCGWWGGTA
jgi:hypothetical protein